MWNDEFELPDGFYSVPDIEDYIEYIIKRHETLTTNPLIHVYINRINNINKLNGINRVVLKMENGYKLELQMPEIVKLFASTE